MEKIIPAIDMYLFEKQFERFLNHVVDQSGLIVVSFNANPYTEKQEGYKYEIHAAARKALDFGSWSLDKIGTGEILKAVINAIEIQNNNLVQWQSRFGDEARPHQMLYTASSETGKIAEYEDVFFQLYRKNTDELSFNKLIEIFGKKYAVIAYLFFIKDRTRFMPIAPTYFDKAFQSLGVDFVTNHRCSWDNYQIYNSLLANIKILIEEKIQNDVSLLDAHSFAWILARQLEQTTPIPFVDDYLALPPKSREAIIMARRGQGKFREAVISYWSSCAITNCKNHDLLIASHIKPWAVCDLREAIDPYNGILLSPSLDVAFDSGYITFSNEGTVLISESLNEFDARALGIDKLLNLRKIAPGHIPYLEYHRKNKFR